MSASNPPRLVFSPSEDPADNSLHSDFSSPISILAVGAFREGQGQFLESHLQVAGILKPSTASPGITQHTYLDDVHKGREAFSKIKALLKKAATRTREASIEIVGEALAAVTSEMR